MEVDGMDIDPYMHPQDVTIPQSEPLPGYSQSQNVAGGYVFEVSDIDKLNRFLCLGTELGYYRANSQHRKFSRTEVQAIDRLIQQRRGRDVVKCIKDVSILNRACKQNPTLYALAVCARSNDPSTKHAAYSVLNDVCRIPTQLFQFIKYCEEMSGQETGWGRAHRIAISQW
ncbi:TROVE2 [Mytilus coruscus]|uniref:TROVE2 n=1 Tax=Mytilus coruscus TaxID=42192 RepID=A0A6J8CH98_MYTCO|nr:TROVE2 [Mytilus coruscus]